MSLADATLLAALIAAAASLTVALITFRQNHKLQEIHVLVNDRLTTALAEIETLKRRVP